MSKRRNLYLGRAGQMLVMAELLCRGWNVAVPEVDIGDDIFVVRDQDGNMSRVQVKTATAKVRTLGFDAKFWISRRHLMTPTRPGMTFVFVFRTEAQWEPCLILPRERLETEFTAHQVGKPVGKTGILLTFTVRDDKVSCHGRDFSCFRDAWNEWPRIAH